MKRYLLLSISLLMLFAACKKDADNKDPQAAHIVDLQGDILGAWYYKQFDIAYFYNSTLFLYNEDATAKDLYDASAYKFNNDGTASYEGKTFNYKITSTAGADSVIFSGANTSRLCITSITKANFQFTSTYPAEVTFQNTGNGNLITSNIAIISGILIRTQAPKP